MAKAKLKSKPGASQAGGNQANPGKVAGKSIMESAQQIWLAGLGAFAKAQGEGSRLFDTLMKEGAGLEQKTRKIAGKVDEVRGAVESGVTQVRERTQETWDKLEQVFENRVSRALGKLGVPGRKELEELIRRVEELARQVRRLDIARPVAAATQSFNSTMRRTRDDLGDLVKDIEEVQLAALHGMRPASKAKPAAPKPARPSKPMHAAKPAHTSKPAHTIRPAQAAKPAAATKPASAPKKKR